MKISGPFAKEFAPFPAALRRLVEGGLKVGNEPIAIEHGFRAPPCGAKVKTNIGVKP